MKFYVSHLTAVFMMRCEVSFVEDWPQNSDIATVNIQYLYIERRR